LDPASKVGTFPFRRLEHPV